MFIAQEFIWSPLPRDLNKLKNVIIKNKPKIIVFGITLVSYLEFIDHVENLNRPQKTVFSHLYSFV